MKTGGSTYYKILKRVMERGPQLMSDLKVDVAVSASARMSEIINTGPSIFKEDTAYGKDYILKVKKGRRGSDNKLDSLVYLEYLVKELTSDHSEISPHMHKSGSYVWPAEAKRLHDEIINKKPGEALTNKEKNYIDMKLKESVDA